MSEDEEVLLEILLPVEISTFCAVSKTITELYGQGIFVQQTDRTLRFWRPRQPQGEAT